MAETGHRDELPDELDVSSFVGPYQFPDNSRRRIPGFIYVGCRRRVLLALARAITTAGCS